MAWQGMSPFPTPRMDAEEEREMRLAAQARAGAEWALAALIARYQPPVLRYLARLTGSPQQSHRLAERIFVRMEHRLRGPHGAEHLRLWLLRAATESGLDELRHPKRGRQQSQLGAPMSPRALLMDGRAAVATDRLRAGIDKIVAITGSTRRQVRQLIWSDEPAAPVDSGRTQTPQSTPAMDIPPVMDPAIDTMDPQEELRHRLVRAVLSELPYGDAQCLALHLVAGLNQAEVARALGIRPSAARHRIVQGLQMFAHRYDAAVTSLGVPMEVAYADDGEGLGGLGADVAGTLDVTQDYTAPTEEMPQIKRVPSLMDTADESSLDIRYDSAYGPAFGSPPGTNSDKEEQSVEASAYAEAFPEVYGDDLPVSGVVTAQVVAASVTEAPNAEAPISEPPTQPIIVDALPVAPSADPVEQAEIAEIPDEIPDTVILDQPTMVPVISGESPDAPNGKADGEIDAALLIPILTPPSER